MNVDGMTPLEISQMLQRAAAASAADNLDPDDDSPLAISIRLAAGRTI